MGIIGLIAVVAIASVITPHLAGDIDQEVKEAEDKHLQAIARGIKAYIRHNQRFPPILDSLRPEYVPYYSSMSLAQNERGHSRYFVIHPNMRGFNNKSGLSASEVADARFLLISHLNHDGAPAIATAAQFETWWMTDERSTPSVTIYRGNVGHFFHQRSSTGEGDGGSDDINETTKKSEGTRASTHDRYHLASTNPGFDEDDAHSPSAP